MSGSALWHPFAGMASVAQREVVMVRGEGVWLWDRRGRRYLDSCSGLWYANVGHGRREIAEAIAAQLEKLETHHVFNDYANEPALTLAERLADLAPSLGSRVMFVSGGGDAIDSAAKLARLYWAETGRRERHHIIGRTGGYHGTHGFGTSLAGIPANREGFGPLIGDVSSVAYDSPQALREEIERLGPSRVAAFLMEPVIASGGVLPPPDGYVREVGRICREYDILLIADCVVGGFGRLGGWFGVERWELAPDLIAFAKGVTSGYLPLGGLVVAPRVADVFYSTPGLVFRHGPTYSGHAAACAAGLANLDLIERERLLERSRMLEGPLLAALATLRGHPLVADVRGGVGALAAFDLPMHLVELHPSLPMDALAAARAAGILTRPLDRGLAVAPPLILEEEHLSLISDGLRQALDALSVLLESGVDLPLGPDALDELDHRLQTV